MNNYLNPHIYPTTNSWKASWEAVCKHVDGNICDESSFWKQHQQQITEEKKENVFNVNELLHINKNVGIVCPKCKERQTSYKLQANRSADEGMTAFCTCRVCEHFWMMKM